jgi:hypothetical protein
MKISKLPIVFFGFSGWACDREEVIPETLIMDKSGTIPPWQTDTIQKNATTD